MFTLDFQELFQLNPISNHQFDIYMSLFRRSYKIEVDQDDWVTPEETLLDAGSEHSDLERPIANSFFRFLSIISGLGFLILTIMVGKIAILDHEYFSALALQNKSVNFSIPPPRGLILDRTGTPLLMNVPSFDLLIVSREANKDILKNRELYNQVASILGQSGDEMIPKLEESLRSNSLFFIANNLSKDQVLALKHLDIKGWYIVSNTKRVYNDGPVFSQIVGYVGRVNKSDLDDPYYSITDSIGRLGIERQYETYLRGEHGRIFFSQGGEIREDIDPKAGLNVVLNIDSDLQKSLHQELKNTLTSAGLSRGAAIIQNPNTGEVLALVSFPSFDTNDFVNGLSETRYKELFENRSKPLFNRVISGQYNPGSTIKPFLGLIALQEQIIKPSDTIQDCVSISLGDFVFKNWRSDYGLFNLRRAIANSCNIFFFIVGGGSGSVPGLGIERIARYLESSLASVKLDIDLPGEEAGFIPTPEWKRQSRGEPWYQGDTYNISIGQGDLLVTPLWLNTYIGAIANGGDIYKPLVANRVVDSDKNTRVVFKSEKITELPFRDEVIAEIKSDTVETVLSGTAQIMKDVAVSVGAKTGTAEVIKGQSANSLFTAFAPVDHPQLAITVLVEGITSNQTLAVRVAHNVFKTYFGSVPAASVAPAP